MRRPTTWICLLSAIGVLAVSHAVHGLVVPFPLKVRSERATPGGVVQAKVAITEPKPISTGGGEFGFLDFDSFEGIAVFSPDNDATGVAVVDGLRLRVTVVSPA